MKVYTGDRDIELTSLEFERIFKLYLWRHAEEYAKKKGENYSFSRSDMSQAEKEAKEQFEKVLEHFIKVNNYYTNKR